MRKKELKAHESTKETLRDFQKAYVAIAVESGVNEWHAWVRAYNMAGQYDELSKHMDKVNGNEPPVFRSKV